MGPDLVNIQPIPAAAMKKIENEEFGRNPLQRIVGGAGHEGKKKKKKKKSDLQSEKEPEYPDASPRSLQACGEEQGPADGYQCQQAKDDGDAPAESPPGLVTG